MSALLLSLPLQELPAQSIKDFERDLVQLSRKVSPAVVSVKTFAKRTVNIPFQKPQIKRIPLSELSGTILGKEGYIATVGDSLKNISDVDITLMDGATFKAEIVGIDEENNLGILWIPATSFPEVTLGDSDRLEVGSFVISVGNPYGFSHSISTGVVSGINRVPEGMDEIEGGMIQVTAMVNPGDAGGMVANSSGEIVGMITSTYQRSFSSQMILRISAPVEHYRRALEEHPQSLRVSPPNKVVDWYISEASKLAGKGKPWSYSSGDLAAQGINFVVPIKRVKVVAKEIIEKGSYSSPSQVLKNSLGILGQWPLSPPLAEQLSMGTKEGVLVAKVTAESVAHRGGVQQYDIIVSLDGHPVGSLEDFKNQVLSCKKGKKLPLEVIRKGQKLALEIVF